MRFRYASRQGRWHISGCTEPGVYGLGGALSLYRRGFLLKGMLFGASLQLTVEGKHILDDCSPPPDWGRAVFARSWHLSKPRLAGGVSVHPQLGLYTRCILGEDGSTFVEAVLGCLEVYVTHY